MEEPPLRAPTRRWLAVVVAAGMALSAFWPIARQAAGAVQRLEDLRDLDQFRERFNQDEGRPRIVLLLSPT